MSVRIQVVLDEEEAERFRSRAKSESKSLSGWFRDVARREIARREAPPLKRTGELESFFEACTVREGSSPEPDWEEHKKLLEEGYRRGSGS